MKKISHLKTFIKVGFVFSFLLISSNSFSQQDPAAGLRAHWMKGRYGLAWKTNGYENGGAEDDALQIDTFLDQVKDLNMLGYIQIPLTQPFIYSPVHKAPHDILESLWEGDVDSDGNIINLVVPRASSGKDPFLKALENVKAAGLRTEIYVNLANMTQSWRVPNSGPNQKDNPPEIPNITERWKNWCDTNAQAQSYINSASYISTPPTNNYLVNERKYMFCYTEFILKEYSERYGDLIDAWTFDSGKQLYQYNSGEDFESGKNSDQLLYKAFANAARSGNPDAAISFNNSQATDVYGENPYPLPTTSEDYTFGHPFYGGRLFGLRRDVDGLLLQYGSSWVNQEIYDKVGWQVWDESQFPGTENANRYMLQWAAERDGNVHVADGKPTKSWDDNIVGHMFPPIASVQWDAGGTPAMTDEQFVEWYGETLSGGASVTLGTPLIGNANPVAWANNNLRIQDFAVAQLKLLDAYLTQNPYPGLTEKRGATLGFDNEAYELDSGKSVTVNNNIRKLSVYPNPTYGNLSISLGNESVREEEVLQIFDIKGMVIYQKQITTSSSHEILNLNLRSLGINNAGIYFVKIMSNDKNYYEKVILK